MVEVVVVDGQSYLSQPLRPNYEANHYVDCYRMLNCFQEDINVNRNDYVKCYCLYVLEIDPYCSFNMTRNEVCQTLTRKRHHDHVCYLPRDSQHRCFEIHVLMMNVMTPPLNPVQKRKTTPCYRTWSRELTHPRRCKPTEVDRLRMNALSQMMAIFY